jgi:hypothetical protein
MVLAKGANSVTVEPSAAHTHNRRPAAPASSGERFDHATFPTQGAPAAMQARSLPSWSHSRIRPSCPPVARVVPSADQSSEVAPSA